MLRTVKKVEYLEGYRLKLYFDNGKIKIVDFEEELKNAKNLFRDLIDISYFKKVTCDGYSISWPNEIDFCPDWLYTQGVDVSRKRLPVRSRKVGRKPKKTISHNRKGRSRKLTTNH